MDLSVSAGAHATSDLQNWGACELLSSQDLGNGTVQETYRDLTGAAASSPSAHRFIQATFSDPSHPPIQN